MYFLLIICDDNKKELIQVPFKIRYIKILYAIVRHILYHDDRAVVSDK